MFGYKLVKTATIEALFKEVDKLDETNKLLHERINRAMTSIMTLSSRVNKLEETLSKKVNELETAIAHNRLISGSFGLNEVALERTKQTSTDVVPSNPQVGKQTAAITAVRTDDNDNGFYNQVNTMLINASLMQTALSDDNIKPVSHRSDNGHSSDSNNSISSRDSSDNSSGHSSHSYSSHSSHSHSSDYGSSSSDSSSSWD